MAVVATNIKHTVMSTLLYVHGCLYASWFTSILKVALMPIISCSDVHCCIYELINRNRNRCNCMKLLKHEYISVSTTTHTPHTDIYIYIYILTILLYI